MGNKRRGIAQPVECIRQLGTNSAYNKGSTIADWQSGFAQPSHEDTMLSMRPHEVGRNGDSEVDCLGSLVSIVARLAVHGLEKCG